MATFHSTQIGTLNIQPRIAGDLALLRGVAKHLLEAARTDPTAIDRQFIDRYTSGFEVYRALVDAVSWDELERVFRTDTGRANFSAAPLADAAPAPRRLILGTMRSHDQWNTTIYSDDDRYRGVKNLRTLIFMNQEDMLDAACASMT